MITSFFKVSKPYHYILFLLFVTFIFFYQSYHEIYPVETVGFLEIFLKFLSLLITLFFVVFIITKNNLTQNNSFAAFYFCLFIFLFPQSITKSEVLISNMFILLSFRRILSLSRKTNFKKKYFDAGIWLFLATFFYPLSLFFILPILIGIITWKTDALSNFFALILGPIMLLCLIKLVNVIFNISIPAIVYEVKMINYEFISSVNFGLKAITLVFISFVALSILMIIKQTILKNNQKKILFSVLFLMSLSSFAIIFTSTNYVPYNFLFSFFPAAIMVANFTQNKKISWISDIFILIIIGVYIYNFINYN